MAALETEYNSTTMTREQADPDATAMLNQAVQALAYSSAPLADRLNALQQLFSVHDRARFTYNLTNAQEQIYTQEVMNAPVPYSSDPNQVLSQFQQSMTALGTQFDFTSMTRDQANPLATTMLNQAVQALASSPAPLANRLNTLQQLFSVHDQAMFTYDLTSMQEQTYTEEVMTGTPGSYPYPTPYPAAPPPPPAAPRYYWNPNYPQFQPTNRQALPGLAMPSLPAKLTIDPSAVSNDPFELLAGAGQLRTQVSVDPLAVLGGQGNLYGPEAYPTPPDPMGDLAAHGQLYGPLKGWWIFASHHQLDAATGKQMLASGQSVYYKNGSGNYQPITSVQQLLDNLSTFDPWAPQKVHPKVDAATAKQLLASGQLFYSSGDSTFQAISTADQLTPYVQDQAHPAVGATEAKSLLSSGQPLFLDTSGSLQPITNSTQLAPAAQVIRTNKLQQLQQSGAAQYQQQVDAANTQDIQNRLAALPPFNSIFNMDGLNANNLMVSQDGHIFNRDLTTAMNLYNQPDVRQTIAQNWHDDPSMTTARFNQMVASVIGQKAGQLSWNPGSADVNAYLAQHQVPGLRYPDTQDAAAWNTQTIQQVTSSLPALLNSNTLQ